MSGPLRHSSPRLPGPERLSSAGCRTLSGEAKAAPTSRGSRAPLAQALPGLRV